ncbi:hypothetical protein SAMN05216388_102639 [Halorientalis persicus]|uniref:Uncharacterized protein n=2 Tax=Halorientalis persicus TaxID=1367881 RepID=A0A1H8U9X9_9EURY|nr:hypothetical protein SAMN05216388_102639 [Halorientalis persicus]
MNRRLEVWASREDNLFEASDDDYRFDHLEPLPDDSPLLTEWNDQIDDEPDRPPVPIEYPTLTLYVTHGENAETDARGFDRIQVGTIVRIEPLDDLSEWPSEPDYEKRELDISLPSRHPSIDFGELDPLIWSDDILEAVFTINRHAKRLDIEADDAYQANAGAEARAYSIQKKALYSVKTIAIHRLVKQEPDKVNVTLHDLGETTMFCFDFGEFSFHQPREAVVDDLFDTVGLDPSELEPQSIDFEPSTNTDDLPKTLPEALATLKQVGLNANSHLDSTSVEDYNFGYHVSTTFDALK